ncbi:MAG TPA: tRNA lysidine(34) synthetase TilS [Methylomirabilota bacterium]|nr:tRNA lysidine(34) synthetase TilS [Methylomirabilota bacterium]
MPDERTRRAPPGPSLVEAVRAAIARHRLLVPGDAVVVGVSGGPDSVALLHVLALLRADLRLRLTACHVHHGLRPEADGEAAFVGALAGRLGCAARVVHVQVPAGGGRSPEEAARLVRHGALVRVAREVGASRVALAHTADDQAETVLMRILQGAGPRGLAGIPVRRGRIVRPLLEVDRAAISAHLRAHGLAAVTDASNRDSRFLRNRIRHELLPLLAAQAGPGLPRALRRTARACREAVEALDALLRPALAGALRPTPVGWRLGLAALTGQTPGSVKTLLRLAVVEAAAGRLASGLRAGHLDALAALPGAPVGACVRLPRGVLVERGRDALWILPPGAARGGHLAVPESVRLGPVRLQARLTAPIDAPEDPAGAASFDAAALDDAAAMDIPGPLGWRRCRPGERILPFGGRGPVRVTRLLATAGVPRRARARWPLVVASRAGGDEAVLWVVGVRRSVAAPVTAGTVAVLRLELQPDAPADEPG